MKTCEHCELEIEYDDTVPNELTGDEGYWRDVYMLDTHCDLAIDNGFGQFLHEPKPEWDESPNSSSFFLPAQPTLAPTGGVMPRETP